MNSTASTGRKILTNAAVAAFWIGLWFVISVNVGQELLVPSPAATLKSLVALAGTPEFWRSVAFSALRIVAGFTSGIIIGAAGGYLSVKSRIFCTVTAPVLHIARAVPVASFIILALVWIKTNGIPVFITALMVAPIIWETVSDALRGIDTRLVEMGRVFALSPRAILVKIKLPQIIPAFLSSATTALGLAWKSGIAAEVICQPADSIGKMLYRSKIYLETPETFAVTLVVVIISVLLELLMKRATRRWQR